jgi:hypothetical protein
MTMSSKHDLRKQARLRELPPASVRLRYNVRHDQDLELVRRTAP